MGDNIIVSLKNINVSYEENTILENLNLDIKDKEFLTLLGPSGCGNNYIKNNSWFHKAGFWRSAF